MSNLESESGGSRARPSKFHLTLQFRMTLTLILLFFATVLACGIIYLAAARVLLGNIQQEELRQFAEFASADIGFNHSYGQAAIDDLIERLPKIPHLTFGVLTDERMKVISKATPELKVWEIYQKELRTNAQLVKSNIGQCTMLEATRTMVLAVPVYEEQTNDTTGTRQVTLGYLHLGISQDGVADGWTRLTQIVVVACLALSLLMIPVIWWVACRVVTPIYEIESAARILAAGKLTHRIQVHRPDEIGLLSEAINTMAQTLQTQQEDIIRINASLESKVEERTEELAKLNLRLNAEMAEKEDFLRAVSHDLNAPLRNIDGMTSMLIMKYKEKLEPDMLQRLERIQKNVAAETELINELLELSRIKSRREKIEQVDLHQLVVGLGEQLGNDLEQKKITFEIQGHLPVMEGEKSRMRQVFQNLIDNAIKYMREDGPRTISITSEKQKSEWLFKVADTGMGIAKEDQPYMFHVFRRAKNPAVSKIPGKGVGLASVKSIIENYGGRLWIESQLGVGTTFHIAIPLQFFRETRNQEVAA